MTWLERGGDAGGALRFAVLDGDRWSEPRTIVAQRTMVVNWADFPTLLVARGRLTAHWLQRTGSAAYDLHVSQSTDGGTTWSGSVVPHRDRTSTEHGFATLYGTAGAAVGVTWLDGRNYAARGSSASAAQATREMMLVSATVGTDGTLGPEQTLDQRVCDCCQTSLAMAAAGPVIVYRDRSPGEIRDISIVRNIRGAWTAPITVHADGWEVDFCPVNGPSVAANGDRLAVAWFTAARDSARVLVAFSEDGGATFGKPVRVDDGRALGRVDVEIDQGDGALVTWIEQGRSADSASVRLRHVARDGVASESRILGPISPGRPSGFPRIARRGGELIVAWTVVGRPPSIHVARVRVHERD